MVLKVAYSQDRFKEDKAVGGEEKYITLPTITLEVLDCSNIKFFKRDVNTYKDIDEKNSKDRFYLEQKEKDVDVTNLIELREDSSNDRDSISIIVDEDWNNQVDIHVLIEQIKSKIIAEYMEYNDRKKKLNEILSKCGEGERNRGTEEYYRYNNDTNVFEVE